jgi:hypothetical protein
MRGTVTYVNAAGHTFVLSARGASLLVHSKATRRHGVRASSDPGIHDGDVVTVDGDLSGDAVDADSVQISGAQSSQISLEGTVQAVDTTGRTLSVSADDDEQSGAAVTVEVPASFDLGTYTVGEPVELVVSSNPDGTYTLQQSSDDSNASSADSIDDQQGDDHGGAQSGSDQSGSGEAAGTVGGADSEAQSGSGSHSGSDG